MRKLFEIIKKETAKTINSQKLELIGIEVGKTVDKETGNVSNFTKVDCEVAKGSGAFSRCQISVKIPDCSDCKVSENDLAENEYQVFFQNLEISYIDSFGNIYFRATRYDIEKEVE